jgi:hypothetical protein
VTKPIILTHEPLVREGNLDSGLTLGLRGISDYGAPNLLLGVNGDAMELEQKSLLPGSANLSVAHQTGQIVVDLSTTPSVTSLSTTALTNLAGPIIYSAGLATSDAYTIGHEFRAADGTLALQILADGRGLKGGIRRGTNERAEDGGHVYILDELFVEDSIWADEDIEFTSYGGYYTTTLAVAAARWQPYIQITSPPWWVHQDNYIVLGSKAGGDWEYRRITKITGDVITLDTNLSYNHSIGSTVTSFKWRSSIFPITAWNKPAGIFRLGAELSAAEALSINDPQVIDKVTHCSYASIADNMFDALVLSGGVVTAQGTPNMTLNVSAGAFTRKYNSWNADYPSVTYEQLATAQVVTIATADSQPRTDVVYWGMAGLAGVAKGAAGGGVPAVPAGGMKLCEVAVGASVTSINGGNLTDNRAMDYVITSPSGKVGIGGKPYVALDVYGAGMRLISTATSGIFGLFGHATNGRYPQLQFQNESGTAKAEIVGDVSTGSVYIDYLAAGTPGGTFNIRNALGSSPVLVINQAGDITTGVWKGTAIADTYISSATTWSAKESALTFSTGLTRSVNTITSNLSVGLAGGQSVYGGAAASETLTLNSTSHATKGKLLFGTSAYDEVNNVLLINQTTIYASKARVDVYATDATGSLRARTEFTSASGGGGLLLYHNNASAALPSSADRLGYVLFGSLDNITNRNGGGITAFADGAWSSTSLPTRFHFEVAPASSTTRAKMLTILSTGSVGMGSGSETPSDALHIKNASTAYIRIESALNSARAYRVGTDGNNLVFDPVSGGYSTLFRTSSGVNRIALVNDTGVLTFTQGVATSGSPTHITVVGGAHTTLAATVEAPDVNFNLARTVQFAAGTLALQRAVLIQAPTYGFASASTLSAAYTLEVSGAPAVGSNATITAKAGARIIGGLVVGSAALATNATTGFLYLPTCAGTPSGAPEAQTGTAAVVYDTTNNKICVYNGAWKQTAALT